MLTFATTLALNTVLQLRLMGMSLTLQVISHKPKYWTNRLFAYDVVTIADGAQEVIFYKGGTITSSGYAKGLRHLWLLTLIKPRGDFSEYQKLLFPRGKNERN